MCNSHQRRSGTILLSSYPDNLLGTQRDGRSAMGTKALTRATQSGEPPRSKAAVVAMQQLTACLKTGIEGCREGVGEHRPARWVATHAICTPSACLQHASTRHLHATCTLPTRVYTHLHAPTRRLHAPTHTYTRRLAACVHLHAHTHTLACADFRRLHGPT